MDEPKEGYYGGQVAAPIFKQIAEAAANYLNIRPENGECDGPAGRCRQHDRGAEQQEPMNAPLSLTLFVAAMTPAAKSTQSSVAVEQNAVAVGLSAKWMLVLWNSVVGGAWRPVNMVKSWFPAHDCCGDAPRVCTDSRQAQAGDLFFALAGGRFDGHDFLDEVARKGAVAVVVERSRKPAKLPDCAVITVDGTRAALGRLAAAYRKDFTLPVVAVAGSNGKTTTKELIASVLRQKLATLWSEASFNNDIGVPLTLLRLEKAHQAAVLEAGTNHPGELAPLVRMIQPKLGVITNIGREHLEFFGDIAGVAGEEGRLAELLPAEGQAVYEWRRRMGGANRRAHDARPWCASGCPKAMTGALARCVRPNRAWRSAWTRRRRNSTASIASICSGVTRRRTRCSRWRSERNWGWAGRKCSRAWRSANRRECGCSFGKSAACRCWTTRTTPTRTRCWPRCGRCRNCPAKAGAWRCSGDMAELGAHSEAAHAEIGRRAAELGVEQLFAVGRMAPVTARAARAAGLNRIFEFADVETGGGGGEKFCKNGRRAFAESLAGGAIGTGDGLVARPARPRERVECFII